ncbi:MAG: nicotinate-nucleotide adenylyltransferase [Beijerinckiaceae bacterium]
MLAIPSPLPALPRHAPGMTIGLFGGSFNPPHEGHRLVTLTALRRLGLDSVWWIITPGNPLKDTRALPPLAERMQLCRALMPEFKIAITGFEASIGTRFTLDTLRYLKRRCPAVRFVWIMGADNLVQFHRWQGWREIARLMPICVVDRPKATLKASASRAGHVLRQSRKQEHAARSIVSTRPPALVFLHGPRSNLSSSAIRHNRGAR